MDLTLPRGNGTRPTRIRWLAGPAPLIVTMALAGTTCSCHAASGGPLAGQGTAGEPASRESFAGRLWVLLEFARDEPAPPQPEITFEVTDDRVSGVAACNQYGASFETDGSTFTLGPMRLTRKACPPPAMSLERRFTAALQAARSWQIEEGRLRIDYVAEEGAERLVFAARELAVRRALHDF